MCVWQGCVVRCVCVARVCGSTLRVRETTMPSKPKQPAAALITSLSLITCAAVGGWQFTESPRDTLPSQHCRPYPRSELRARSPPYTISTPIANAPVCGLPLIICSSHLQLASRVHQLELVDEIAQRLVAKACAVADGRVGTAPGDLSTRQSQSVTVSQ